MSGSRKSRKSRASRKSIRKSRVSRRRGSRKSEQGPSGPGPGAKRLARLGVDPHKTQLALCVRALYDKLVKQGESKGRATLGRSFAICTASLQDKGYLKNGSNEPTAKGVARSLELAEEAGTAGKLERYEQILKLGRGGRPARGGAEIIDMEKLLREDRKSRKTRKTRTRRKAAA